MPAISQNTLKALVSLTMAFGRENKDEPLSSLTHDTGAALKRN